MIDRRDFLGRVGGFTAVGAQAGAGRGPLPTAAQPPRAMSAAATRLYATIVDLPVDDTHCHPISDKDEQTTERQFLERLALAAFPAASYFPSGVLREYQSGTSAVRERLDRQYGIEKVLSEITCRQRCAAAAIVGPAASKRGTQ